MYLRSQHVSRIQNESDFRRYDQNIESENQVLSFLQDSWRQGTVENSVGFYAAYKRLIFHVALKLIGESVAGRNAPLRLAEDAQALETERSGTPAEAELTILRGSSKAMRNTG